MGEKGLFLDVSLLVLYVAKDPMPSFLSFIFDSPTNYNAQDLVTIVHLHGMPMREIEIVTILYAILMTFLKVANLMNTETMNGIERDFRLGGSDR